MPLPLPSTTSTALVTGASSGIGVDLARELAGRGHGVVLVARRTAPMQALAAKLATAHGIRAEVLGCDLTDPDELAALPGRVAELGLTVDLLVNNAGYGSGGAFETLEPASEARMVRLNCEAVVALTYAFLPGMLERGSGAVLVVASSAGFQPVPRQVTYGATKAFALSFSEGLHTELSGRGVAVTALCPGPVETGFAEAAGVEGTFDRVPRLMYVASADVARQAVDGLADDRRVVVPGLVMKALGAVSAATPHAVLLPILRRFYPV